MKRFGSYILLVSVIALTGCAQLQRTAGTTGKDSAANTAENAKLSSAIASAAKEAQDSGMTRESLMLQEKLYHNDPNNQDNILNYARSLRMNGRIEAAKLVIRTPAKATRVTEPILTEAAMVLISAGEYDEALGFAQKAVEKNKQSVDAHHALALALSGLGEYGDAQLQFQETIQMWPQGRDQTAVINNLAMALAAQGKISEARAIMSTATGEALRSQTYQNNRALLENLKDTDVVQKEILQPVIPQPEMPKPIILPTDSDVSLESAPVKPKAVTKSEPVTRATRKTTPASKAIKKVTAVETPEPAPQAAPARSKMAPIVE